MKPLRGFLDYNCSIYTDKGMLMLLSVQCIVIDTVTDMSLDFLPIGIAFVCKHSDSFKHLACIVRDPSEFSSSSRFIFCFTIIHTVRRPSLSTFLCYWVSYVTMWSISHNWSVATVNKGVIISYGLFVGANNSRLSDAQPLLSGNWQSVRHRKIVYNKRW